MIIVGKALKYGDAISTDQIYPGRYLALTQPPEMAQAAMAGLDFEFPLKIKDYGVVVAGKYFGCGSSREHAPLSMKYAGTKCIIAESFARIFFRNAVNIGLPIVELKDAAEKIAQGDSLLIDLSRGIVRNETKAESYTTIPLPAFLLHILLSGGLMEYINSRG